MGLEFYQTKLGQIFFNAQLPRLVNALEKIADNLENPDDKMAEKENENDNVKVDLGFAFLVAKKNTNSEIPGIYLFLEDKEGRFMQDIVSVERTCKTMDDEFSFKDSVTVRIWGDGNSEEYTDKFNIEPYNEDAQ